MANKKGTGLVRSILIQQKINLKMKKIFEKLERLYQEKQFNYFIKKKN